MQTIAELRALFEKYCSEKQLGSTPASLYDPAHYIMKSGGKRMRPLLLLSSYYIYNDRPELALPAAYALEVFHNFTLVHDDIMDDAEKRRSFDSVHKAFGTNRAILSGDVMLIRSYEMLMSACPDDKLREIMGIYSDIAAEICEGQQLDMDFETIDSITVDEYLHMNTQKTAVLLGAAMQIGALLGGGDRESAQQLFEAGLLLGRAFQVQDDLLDAYGKETGKKRGGDIINAKKTYLYVVLLNELSPMKRGMFVDLYSQTSGNPEVKIQKVLRWFDDHDVRSKAEDYFSENYSRGVDIITTLKAPEKRKTLLLEMIGQLEYRKS